MKGVSMRSIAILLMAVSFIMTLALQFSASSVSLILASTDTTPPTTIANISGTEEVNGWYASSVEATLSASDEAGGSGVNITMYKLDAEGWTVYSTPLSISSDGVHVLRYYSIDYANNTESTKNATISIDRTPPSLTLGQTSGSVFGSSTVRITWTSSDAMSGIDHFEVYSDGALWDVYDNSTREGRVSNFDDGQHSVTMRAFDKAGNMAEKTISFEVRMNQGGIGVVEIAAITGAIAALLAVVFLLIVMRRKKNMG